VGRPNACDCKCDLIGSVFNWGRYIRRVGEQTANAALSDFSTAWTSYEALAPTESPPYTEMKMKPIRYELGVYGGGNFTELLSRSQMNAGPRSTAPPITGHLRKTTVSEVQIPGTIALNTGTANGRNSADSILRAVELFFNGTSVELFDFGSTVKLEDNGSGSIYVHDPLVLTLATPIQMVPSDTISFDLYTHVKARPTGFLSALSGSVYGTVFAPTGTQSNNPTVSACQLTGVRSRLTEVTGYKLVFSDTGPSGLTEFELHAQSGWSVDASGTIFTRDIGPYYDGCVITFNWLREIPYIEISYPDTFPIVLGTRVRYYMQGSGDYTAIDIPGGHTLTYSIWDHTSPAVFDARVVLQTGGSRWYSELELSDSPYFDGWPNSITVELI